MHYQLLATLLIVLLVGCEPPPAQPGPATTSPAAAPTMGATTVWNQAQVEQFLKEEFELKTIALQSTGSDNYQGTGADAEGTIYTLTVIQVPGGIKVEWRTTTGHGAITFGKPVP